MALVRNAANMIRKGRVGDATYYVSKGQQIVRQARNDSNYGESARRSENQQVRRVMWANLVNFYKASASWMPAAFESKKKGQTDYNKFMQVNMNGSRIALTKDQAAAGACVADAYLITQGSLPSVEISQKGVAWYTNIGIGDLVISANTTNAELTAAMIANNANIQEGMQISFVSYQQSLDAMGMPRLICRLYEITLSRTSTDKVWDFLPEFCATSVNKSLGTSGNISIGGFAYIVSDKRAGQVRVSTQQLVVNNNDLISQYTSGEHVRAAMLSYGIDSEVILSPDGINQQGAEPQPVYISRLTIEGLPWMPNTYVGTLKDQIGNPGQLMLANAEGSDVAKIDFIVQGGMSFPMTIIEHELNYVNFEVTDRTYPDAPVVQVKATMTNGKAVNILFSPYTGGMGGDL